MLFVDWQRIRLLLWKSLLKFPNQLCQKKRLNRVYNYVKKKKTRTHFDYSD